jgi:hypothetical protein
MKITHYSFGKIVIEGKTYTSDVIIYPDHVDPSWWRKEGHLLQKEDVEDIIKSGISTAIIGTGYYSTMRVPKETLDYLRSNGIEAFIENTQSAAKSYNEVSDRKPVIAALHLTC